ncbi:MAG: transposase, partial [Treponema sp.]|nr:transposase [Treponema sp.]
EADALSEVYRFLCPLNNYFLPPFKLPAKEKRADGRYKKVYEKAPKTPFERLMEPPLVSDESKAELTRCKGLYNPLRLNEGLHRTVAALLRIQRGKVYTGDGCRENADKAVAGLISARFWLLVINPFSARKLFRQCDTFHKLSTELVKRYDVICVEDLHIKNMVKNRRLAKSVNDAAWGEFVRQLAYKCGWQHKAFVKADTFFPSSQTCGGCGSKNSGVKDLSVRNRARPGRKRGAEYPCRRTTHIKRKQSLRAIV